MSSIDEIKSRIDILDLAAEAGVKLRRTGRNHTGFCPFHSNTRTPAFVVWPESGTWRCFGECNEGGDIFKFVMKKEGIDFKEALQRLADKAGVTLERLQPEKPEQKEENQRLRNLLEDAVTFYRHQLLQTEAGKVALTYLLEKRNLTMETIETFGLGYAPHSWDATLNYFKGKHYSEQDILDVGLLSERDNGGYYDKFRHRIMIPIRDENGKMTGFGGRILDPNDIPKFMNSPQTVLFDKGRLLYGLDRARKPIRTADQAVIVEGYLDVIAVHQAGYENVVSPMGTALTDDQLRMLKRFTRKIVLALDPDVAGQKAVLRGLDAAREAMDREDEIGFDARGLLRHEARLQADLRVATMPDDLDPDEIVAREPEEWARLIAAAKPIVEHVLDSLVAERDINDPKAKAEIAAHILPLIEDLPNPVERDSYRQMLARRLKIDERSLNAPKATGGTVQHTPRRKAEPAEGQPIVLKPVPVSPFRRMEAVCLGYILRRPELLPRLDRRLQESGLSALSAADFEYTDYQSILLLIQHSQEQDESDTTAFVHSKLVDELSETHSELLAQPAPKGADDRVLDELTRQVLQMRRTILAESVNQLRFLVEETQAVELNQTAQKYARVLQAIDQARKRLSEYRRE
ncbi:MAG: DNA primase [Chloroflexi bacterium HGW-Chloroflexi-6]|nr:MAG: DNA primase [Chloroflexi bacterium HGW-Chloroflexi-6]